MQCQVQLFEGAAYAVGRTCLDEAGHVVIGISPMNSFYTKEQIKMLLQEASRKFSRVTLFSCDLPCEHNLRALGYQGAKLSKKVRHETNHMHNKIQAAMNELSLICPVVNWATFQNHAKHEIAMNDVRVLYAENEVFRDDVLKCTWEFLCAKTMCNGRHVTDLDPVEIEAALDISKEFILSEFAFFSVLPDVFQLGTAGIMEQSQPSRIAWTYHRRFPLLETYLEQRYTNDGPFGRLGFLVLGPVQM